MAGRSPSCRIAGRSSRRSLSARPIKQREDALQVYLLPVDGGEARRLTDLPRGVSGFEWSPDGSRLVVVSTSHAATFKEDRKARGLAKSSEPGSPPDRPTTGSWTGSTTCSTAKGSRTTRSATCGWWTSRPARPRRLTDGPTAEHDAGLVAGWHAHRLLGGPASRSRPDLPLGPVHDRRRSARDHGRDRRTEVVLQPTRPGCRTAASIVALGHRFPSHAGLAQRPLALLGGRLRREPGRWPEPLGRARPDARLRHEQRCHDRRRDPRHPVAGRCLADVHRADPGGLRAVPDRGGRRPPRADHGRPALHLGLGRGRGGGDRRPAPDRLPALDADRGARTSSGWTAARIRVA